MSWLTDEVHNQNTEFDSKLLNHHNTSTNILFCNFCQIYRNLTGSDTNTDTIENTTSDKLSNTMCSNLNDCSKNPPKASENDTVPATKFVRYEACHQGPDHRSCC